MLVGVPKEIKEDEYRVGTIPATVSELVSRGHRVVIEKGAGAGAGLSDDHFVAAGAEIATNASAIFDCAELIVKVKEPLAAERKKLRQGQILFTYLHLAADPAQTQDLMAAGVTAIAYETVTDAQGKLPLLTPMSEVAGRMSPQVGAHFLERPHGGRGVLLGGVTGVAPANVFVLGTGVVARNAAQIALGMGAAVTVAAHRAESVQSITSQFAGRVRALLATGDAINETCMAADLVIAAALVPGGAAPKLIPAATVKYMKAGAVIVDVSIDQGGCAETSHPTTHSRPTYLVNDVVHYCVANMPGAVARTSTFALNNATRPYVLALADKGLRRAMAEDVDLRNGLNVHEGRITCRPVADALRLGYVAAEDALGIR
jgi:alanine dehydrogenase